MEYPIVIAAGKAIGSALGARLDSPGAARSGWALVPAAEALASASLERDAEPRLVSNVEFSDQRVGGLATDVASRFLRELAESAQLNLHVRLLEGTDPQHVLDRDLQGGRRRARPGVPSRTRVRRGGNVTKEAVRTEAAPAPFQGAPYSQAIKANGLRVRLRPAVAEAGREGALGRRDHGADRAGVREPPRHPRGGRLVARPAREDDGLPPEPRRLRRDERGLLEARRRARRRRGRPSRSRSSRPARSSRSRRSHSSRTDRGLRRLARARRVRRRRRGARRAARRRVEGRRLPRTGRRHRGPARCARAARRHRGAVVAGRPVGVRHYPRDRAIARARPGGIELAPPRREVSTGPGRHDFEIVVDPAAPVEEDLRAPRLHDQRDGAASRRRRGSSTRTAGGRTSSAASLRTVSPSSFAEDPLRIVRGLRFVSQLDLDPTRRRSRRCATRRRASRSSRASGSAAGSPPTGSASCRSSCSAAARRRRCGSRATPACS